MKIEWFPEQRSTGTFSLYVVVSSFFISVFDIALLILYPICTQLASEMPENLMMLGVSLLRKIFPPFFPREISNFLVFLVSLNEKFISTTVQSMVVRTSTIEL